MHTQLVEVSFLERTILLEMQDHKTSKITTSHTPEPHLWIQLPVSPPIRVTQATFKPSASPSYKMKVASFFYLSKLQKAFLFSLFFNFLLYFFHYHVVPLGPPPPIITTLLSMSMSLFAFLLNPSLPHLPH